MRGYCLLLSLCLFVLSNLSAAERYDAFLGNVLGSARVIGLGGAYHTLAEGIEGSLYNPAGLSEMESWWDLDFNFGVYNEKTKAHSNFLGSASQQNYYVQMGMGFKVKKWRNFGFGISVSNPYSVSVSGLATSDLGTSDFTNFDFSYILVSFPAAISLNEQWKIGASLRSTFADMSFSSVGGTTNEKTEAEATGSSFTLGVIYQHDETQRYSLVYEFGEQLDFKFANNTDIEGYSPFKESVRPHRIYLGTSFHWNERLRSHFDLGLTTQTKRGIVAGSGIAASLPAVKSGRDVQAQYFMGAEYLVFPGVLEARLGHYFQPARSSLDPERFHLTGGLDYFFWYVRVGFAGDWAKDYYLFTFALSPSFSHRDRKDRGTF